MKKEKLTYQGFVNKIAMDIKSNIESGCGSWVDNFDRDGCFSFPVNSQGKHYKGVNVFALLFSQLERSYKSNSWLTFKQIKELGGSVLKGESSETVFFFTQYNKEEIATKDIKRNRFENGKVVIQSIKKGDKVKMPFACAKSYNVFNLTQTTLKEEAQEIKINTDIQKILDYHKPEIIHHDQGRAYYMPELDVIKMPYAKYFKTNDDYFSTLIHEICHFTLAESRLNRSVDFSCKRAYAKEELVAELSSTTLMKHFGINGEVKNHASYIESWLTLLTDEDYQEAVKQSSKVISYLLNVSEQANYEKVA